MPHFSTIVRRGPWAARRPGRGPSSGHPTILVGPWELLRRIHLGNCSEVWLARPDGGDDRCADYVVKLLRHELEDDPVAQRMLAHEAAAGRAVSHPHLAPVLQSQLRHKPRHLVLPRLEGVTLGVLRREGQCSMRRAFRAARQTAEALSALHLRQWRHGDVKPANIIVSPDGHATLFDLGMAAPADEPLAGAGGTPPYTAPEARDGGLGLAGDIYSLGATLCELLSEGPTGARGWADGDDAGDVVERLPAAAPRGTRQLLRRMLSADPLDRPTAAAAIDELTPLEIAAFAAEAEAMGI